MLGSASVLRHRGRRGRGRWRRRSAHVLMCSRRTPAPGASAEVACTTAQGCGTGNVCCYLLSATVDAGTTNVSACMTSCTTGARQTCATNADCPAGFSVPGAKRRHLWVHDLPRNSRLVSRRRTLRRRTGLLLGSCRREHLPDHMRRPAHSASLRRPRRLQHKGNRVAWANAGDAPAAATTCHHGCMPCRIDQPSAALRRIAPEGSCVANKAAVADLQAWRPRARATTARSAPPARNARRRFPCAAPRVAVGR